MQSSSVSMFVGDPRNHNNSAESELEVPTRFYRITSFVHPTITTEVCSDNLNSNPQHKYENVGSSQYKPREITHKIRREGSASEEKENDNFIQNSIENARQQVPYNRRCASATLTLRPPTISLAESGRKTKRHSIHVSNNCSNDRKVTSVNVTLHSPSGRCNSSLGNSRPNILSESYCGGTRCRNSLIYSTGGNSRDGFRSQLQIQIGPNGGSVPPSRRRNLNHTNENSLQQMNADLIAAQLERKEKLERALKSERSVMAKLGAEISLLRTKLQPLPSLERLKNENERLRIECGFMAKEVDLYDNGAVPLGWTLEDFYQGINPGQDALLFNGSAGRRPTGTRSGGPGPPPRPPPPRFLPIPPQPSVVSGTGEWYCTMCTFQNHCELSMCEQCGMVRVITPNREQKQNIHIRVRHHTPERLRRVEPTWEA